MVIPNTTISNTMKSEHHKLGDSWTLRAHLPHDTDWTPKSYKNIFTMSSVEEAITITETLPEILVKNCMLFIMREGIKPIWEDVKNRNGGCFSYKVINKNVYDVWREFTYALVGNTISTNESFVASVNGITISPKKTFVL